MAKIKSSVLTCLRGFAIPLFALVALSGQAKDIVWEQPTTEFGTSYGDGYFHLALDVTKVELKDSETVVYITASQRSDNPNMWFRFASGTYLNVGGTRYAVTSADGIAFDQQVQTHKDGHRDMVFHFQPLPKGTKEFDFIEGDGPGAFQIKGIKPVEERWKQLFPSYWRDDKGDWMIAFLDDYAIYDCRFWDYQQCDVNQKTGEATMVLTNGNDELKVVVGKNKKGTRTIQMGDQKAVYSMITSRYLPDYPTKDPRTDFVDNGYTIDTVTVVGWLKDMPEHFKSMKAFEFNLHNLFTDEEESVYADLDEQGRFSVKIPVWNSTAFVCDWSRCFIRTMFEPGKTYFLLYDFKEGRRYFMGDDCRLQNELFKYPLDRKSLSLYDGLESAGKGTPQLFDTYIASVDSLITTQQANIDALCEAHPTLSSRFNLYRKGHTLMQQASNFAQSRFRAQGLQLPDRARRYAFDTFWTKIEKPYTLHYDIGGFLNNYLDDAAKARGNTSFSYSILDHYQELASNDEELALLTRWKKWIEEATSVIEAEPTVEAKIRKSRELDSLNADLTKEVDKILQTPKATKLMTEGLLIKIMKEHRQTLDSLGADTFTKDFWLFRQVMENIDDQRTSLLPKMMDTLKAYISNPTFIAMIEEANNRYLAIENREFDKLVLKSSDNLAGLSEGEALLKKIIEPYKGKFVLLDIWGTWCGPCKEALSHSTEEYARLNDFDIEFLYLANRSPQRSWENVIKEYNVSGPNVAHYNLPDEQQRAIERHLKVNEFPTYKLFDREGRLLDVNADPRDLEILARLLQQMK